MKINKHIDPRIYDFPYILPLIQPTQKGPKQWPFSEYFSDYNTSSRCIYQNVLMELRLIRMRRVPASSNMKNILFYPLLCIVLQDESTKMQERGQI